jgi:hypothetical protein
VSRGTMDSLEGLQGRLWQSLQPHGTPSPSWRVARGRVWIGEAQLLELVLALQWRHAQSLSQNREPSFGWPSEVTLCCQRSMQVSVIAGDGREEWADGQGTKTHFKCPACVAVYGDGNIIFGDALNHIIRKMSPYVNVEWQGGLGRRARDAGALQVSG